MLENGDFLFFSYFVEIVHIQLPHERGKFLMLEILGQNLIFKKILIFDDKAVPIVSPLNDMTVLFIFQNLIGLHYKVRDLLSAVHTLFVNIGL